MCSRLIGCPQSSAMGFGSRINQPTPERRGDVQALSTELTDPVSNTIRARLEKAEDADTQETLRATSVKAALPHRLRSGWSHAQRSMKFETKQRVELIVCQRLFEGIRI